MTTPYKRKLIEVAIPLEAINAASAYEKMPGIGPHPRGLHQYWARRPLVACRAILFAQLVDDPSSLPDQFPTTAMQDEERKRLFSIIEDLVKWENSANEEVIGRARAEILRSCNGTLPPIYDPFSGGGSIPLEAQRLGLPAYGSDLNPLAVTIGKAMIEIPYTFKGQPPVHPGAKSRNHYRGTEGLAEDVKYYAEWMREKANVQIGHLYPKVTLPKENGGGEGTVIAWIWARTVPSPDPAFSGSHIPIAASFVLSSKKGKEVWIEPVVDKKSKTISYHIRQNGSSSELDTAKGGTKVGRGANFFCLFSGSAVTPKYITEAGKHGNLGQTLIAVVAEGKRGRIYIAPSALQEETAMLAKPTWKPEHKQPENPRWFAPPAYGMETFGDLFTQRQLEALNTFKDLVGEARLQAEADAACSKLQDDGKLLRDGGNGAKAYAEAISVYLAFILSRCADYNNSFVGWNPSNQKVMHLFGKQSIPMIWDFGEANILANVVGGFQTASEFVAKCIERLAPSAYGTIAQSDAQTVSYPSDAVISTDPPYYDNIGYADLSDFFYVWMKPILNKVFPDIHSLLSTPKQEELVATPYRHGGKRNAEAFFLDGMTAAISRMALSASREFPTTIYYAFKQSEIAKEGISSTGWATFLQAVITSGFSVVGTWPVRSEQTYRMVATGTNALANSVVLVCRKKDANAGVITRAEFIRALERELPSAIRELQAANIAPADMPQSAIGPGMGVFSRHQAILESDDSPMTVKVALQLINRQLDEYLGGIQGEFDADTRFAISWFEQNGFKAGDYGTANNLATARGISVESVKHAGIIESAAGKVRILTRDEIHSDWEPTTDSHLTIWECLQHLVRVHETDGLADTAAEMLKQIGSNAEAVKDLAYCLYDICANKRKDAKEATAYNALIADWTELTRLAASASNTRRGAQMRMDV